MHYCTTSLLTPTYERPGFLKLLANMICSQTVALAQTEWIILDDSVHPQTWLARHPISKRVKRVVYQHVPRMPIGQKRNRTLRAATGDICIQMDDDDYYGPDYIANVLHAFRQNPTVDVVGSSMIQLIYPASSQVWRVGPFWPNHACAATLSCRRTYAQRHAYDDDATHAEERRFLNNYRTPLHQLVTSATDYIALVHTRNTVDKFMLRRRVVPPLHWMGLVPNADALLTYVAMAGYTPLPAHAPLDAHWNLLRAVYKALLQFMYVANMYLRQNLVALKGEKKGELEGEMDGETETMRRM